MARQRLRRVAGERGSMALELSIIAPAIVALLVMMISAGRVVQSASKVQGAARDGARAASINHNGRPFDAANAAVAVSLQANGVTCIGNPVVSMASESPDHVQHGQAPQPGDSVRVTVDCQVALLFGQATTHVSRVGVSVLDTFRGTT
jgi:Flp pilus assembly protein TadG